MTFEELNRFGLNVSRETFFRLSQYVQLLLEWNQKINLIGRSSEQDIWQRHLIDSLQLTRVLPDPTVSIADLGSGAGLPGVVLALSGYSDVTLIEKNSKKATFLRNVSRETSTPFRVLEKDLTTIQGSFDVIISRGLSRLDTLLEYSYPLLKKKGVCVFLKGETADDEILAANLQHWKMTIEKKESITNPRASLLIITNIEKAQERYAKNNHNRGRESKRRRWKNNDHC